MHSGFFGPCTEGLQPCSVRFGSSVRVTVGDLRTGCTLAEGILILLCTFKRALEIKGIIKMQFATQKSKHVYKINSFIFQSIDSVSFWLSLLYLYFSLMALLGLYCWGKKKIKKGIKKQHPYQHSPCIDAALTASLMAHTWHVTYLSSTEVVFDISEGFQALFLLR